MKKKVLYITNLPAPYKVEFFNELGKYVELTVIFERASAKNRNKTWISSLKEKRYNEIWLSGLNFGNEMCLDLSIIAHLKRNRNHLVLINGYSSPTEMTAILYMKLHKMKFGLVCDGLLRKKESTVKEFLKKALISAASFWMSSGEGADEVLVAHGAEYSRIFRYPFTSIRESDIASVPYNKKYYKDLIGCNSKYMLLYVGQMIHRKGIDILDAAVQGMDIDIKLYLIGGSTSASSEKVVNIGFMDKSTLKNYYMAADLFVLPSREDIWGLVINEAMGYGVPVIATNQCGAALEMIEEGRNGAIVPVENTSALREKIVSFLQNLDAESTMFYTTEKAKNYTIEKMAKCTWEAISQW